MAQEEGGEERSRRRGADGSNGIDDAKRCGLWLPSKRRFCASHAVASSLYCGNHDPSAGEKRVPCPVDSSHTVLQNDIASHVKKCQATKHIRFIAEQPYYRKGVNVGSDGEEEEEFVRTRVGSEKDDKARVQIPSPSSEIALERGNANEPSLTECHSKHGRTAASKASENAETGVKFRSSAAKRAAITALSEAEFEALVRRIEYSHEACTQDEVVEESVLQPPQCLQWWDGNRDRRLPFQEKHVSQQASMLGNLEAFGLLKGGDKDEISQSEGDCEIRTYVEFGAGRGYLSQMLCDSYGVSSVLLVERKAYKHKADRTLRQLAGVSMERLRTDIEDLYLHGVKSLQGRRYVAASKHLCGPATDMTLRCCLKEVDCFPGDRSEEEEGGASSPALEGIGIATCCHHLCQWRSYVGKHLFRRLGFSEAEFLMITWLTSWAVSESGDQGGGEHSELESVRGRRAGSDETPFSRSTELARIRLSEAMDALDIGARAELGRKCKHLIDFGRLLFLRRHGLEGKIVTYISACVSPENRLLLARKRTG